MKIILEESAFFTFIHYIILILFEENSFLDNLKKHFMLKYLILLHSI